MSSARSLHRLPIVVLVVVLCAGLLPVVQAAPPKPKVNWSPCYRDLGPFECGTVQVPLDYSRPGTATISIALVRLPAANPATRIGSLFLNPGGPGGSGVDFALYVAPYFAAVGLGNYFDIVGFDPRGIYRSTALRCFGNTNQFIANEPPFVFPMTSEQEAMLQASDEALVDACDQRAGRIIDHMTTADVARDLDLLRQAVGDEQLTYLGFSYGSYLGATYANLFPERVRAVAIDAVLDPRAWATGVSNEGSTVPLPVRLQEHAATEDILAEFFRLCDAGGANCALAPNSAARFAALADRIEAEPVLITLPDGSNLVLTYDILIVNVLVSMYTSATWPDLAGLLAAIESVMPPEEVGLRYAALHEQLGLTTKRGTPKYANYEGQDGVTCSDTDNPRNFATWSAAAAAADALYPNFGRIWTWIWAGCATWPGPAASRYAGPFDQVTANPVLVVGSIYDPATPYEGAVAAHNLLPNSALLTVDGWGHGSMFMSSCAFAVEANYLVTGATPSEDMVCPVDVVPFAEGPAVLSAPVASTAAFNVALAPESLKRQLR